MNSLYKTFLHKFQSETIGQGLSVNEVAKMMCVHPKTVYGWFALRASTTFTLKALRHIQIQNMTESSSTRHSS